MKGYSDSSLLWPLKGIIPPLVTPLTKNGELDVNSFARLIEHVLSGGVQGVFILGTTGEAPGLSYDTKKQVISCACRMVKGRVPVLVGVTDCSYHESITLAKLSADAGASAIVTAPPYYFQLDQKELTGYFHYLAGNSPLPLFLYNIPSHTKISIEPACIRMLAQHPNIIGLKDSSGNGVYFNTVLSLLKAQTSFALFVGPDEMMASMVLIGAHGGVSAGANLFPKLYVDLYTACIARDFDRIHALQQKVVDISLNIYNAFSVTNGFLKGIKATLSVMEICDDHMEVPLSPLHRSQKEKIKEKLFELKLIDPR